MVSSPGRRGAVGGHARAGRTVGSTHAGGRGAGGHARLRAGVQPALPPRPSARYCKQAYCGATKVVRLRRAVWDSLLRAWSPRDVTLQVRARAQQLLQRVCCKQHIRTLTSQLLRLAAHCCPVCLGGVPQVRLPRGVAPGTRLRYPGLGDELPGAAGRSGPSAARDLVLVVRELPHPRYARRGSDLTTQARAGPPVTLMLQPRQHRPGPTRLWVVCLMSQGGAAAGDRAHWGRGQPAAPGRQQGKRRRAARAHAAQTGRPFQTSVLPSYATPSAPCR
jgi:hypothetical protein